LTINRASKDSNSSRDKVCAGLAGQLIQITDLSWIYSIVTAERWLALARAISIKDGLDFCLG